MLLYLCLKKELKRRVVMYLIVVEKVVPEQKVHAVAGSRSLFPDNEYQVIRVEPKIAWDHSDCMMLDEDDTRMIGYPDPTCPGCGYLYDGQELVIRNSEGKEGRVDSTHFCSSVSISFEALDSVKNRRYVPTRPV
jgi:hypothetical protein